MSQTSPKRPSIFFDHQALFVTNYKKAKHGAPIIRGSKLAQQEFYVLAPDLSGSKRYQFTKFNSEPLTITTTWA